MGMGNYRMPRSKASENAFGCLLSLFMLPFKIIWIIISAPFKVLFGGKGRR